ncbi:MAG: NUDIX domain-containing protein [Candidatus Zambryskibacteria bacterium]|nr:NUDIX domain-containing protein [Candidatus Zambryskibacteria bacterium]
MAEQIKETKSAGGVVVNSEGKVLVVNQKGDSWSLPKGHIDMREDAITAAKREVYEESGISDLKLIKELGSYQRYRIGKGGVGDDKTEVKIIIMFLFTTLENAIHPIDPENPEAKWVPREKVAALLTHPKDKEFFLSIVSEI